MFLFCSLCFLEWSKCCYCFDFLVYFVCICLFCLCLFVLCLFLSVSYENHCFPCISRVLGYVKHEIRFLVSVSGSCFCFCFVYFLFQDVRLFLFFCLFSCFVLSHSIILFCFSFCFCCCCCCCFFAFVALDILLFLNCGYQKYLSKIWKFRKPPKRNMQKKTDIWTRTVSTNVFTNRIFCVFTFCMFAENTIKSWFQPPKKQKWQLFKYVAQQNWTKFKFVKLFLCFIFFEKIFFYLQGEQDFEKLDQF